MEDEYDSLMLSLGIPPTDATAASPTSAEPSESLLDVEDEDEVLVLDPPPRAHPCRGPDCFLLRHRKK